VLDAVAPAPVIVQIAPGLTGTSLEVVDLKALAAKHPNLALVKVEAQPSGRMITALAQPPRPLRSTVGYAGIAMMDALTRGAVGVQPGCSFVEVYQEIWAHWESGELEAAEDLHRRLLPFISYWMQNVELIVAAEKVISQERGWIAHSRCRAPAWRLDKSERRQITRFLDTFGSMLCAPTRPE
jgi:dihydrodipicolinate synthase/N-acetylneuraminate lyase